MALYEVSVNGYRESVHFSMEHALSAADSLHEIRPDVVIKIVNATVGEPRYLLETISPA